MPKEKQIIIPSIKVKRLARLFDSSRSPSKAMTSKKEKNVRREKISRIRNAMNEELSSENENMPSQQHEEQGRQEPVVPQPMGRQEQGTAAAKEGEKGKEKEDISTVAKKSYEDANEIMKNFLSRGAATAGAEGNGNNYGGSTSKRTRDEQVPRQPPAKRQEGGDEDTASESSVMEVESRNVREQERPETAIRSLITKCRDGEVGLEEACQSIVSLINRRLEEQLTHVKRAAEQVYQEKQEEEKAARSLVIFNADKWQIPEQGDGLGVQPLADRITGAVHRLTSHMVSVQETIPMGPRREGKEPNMVRIILGSNRQKATLFRCLAAHTRNRTRIGEEVSKVSIRDYFPREKVNDAKILVKRGAVLKRNGRIAGYRVVARGEGCFPILEVRYDVGGGRRGPWVVFQTQMYSQDRAATRGERLRSRSRSSGEREGE